MNADIKDFSVIDGVIQAQINQLDTNTSWKNTQLTSLSGQYFFSPTEMKLTNATIQTNSSFIESNILLQYPKRGLKNFTEAVQFDVKITNAKLGQSDMTKAIPNWTIGNIDFNGGIIGKSR